MLIDLQQLASATIRTSHTDNQMKQIIKVHMPEADREEIWLHIGIQHVKKLPWSNIMPVAFEAYWNFRLMTHACDFERQPLS